MGTPKDVPEFTVLGFGSEELRVADYSEDVEISDIRIRLGKFASALFGSSTFAVSPSTWATFSTSSRVKAELRLVLITQCAKITDSA